ncbi:S41 family peptidase [Actinomadura fibrosa]|uniref:S41 family peptidase n=1 Tax=Actinomadura fibrosa TaxID=111802 RepID=A0ABW2Y4Z3_9ACTN|nr:S41 family peptidase [Actinomadura fibrosa]
MRTTRQNLIAVVSAAVTAGVIAAGATATANPRLAAPAAAKPSPCVKVTGPMTTPADPAPTSVSTVQQAYYCILDNYYKSSKLDHRQLLQSAFDSVVTELIKRGIDQPDAAMPALSGDRDNDWTVFGTRLGSVLAAASDQQPVRSALAVAAIKGMVAALHDNHARYRTAATQSLSLGLTLNQNDPGGDSSRYTVPLFIKAVTADSPAATAGLKPGDVIRAVNGVPPFSDGTFNAGVMDYLRVASSTRKPVRITVQRPSTGRTRTFTITPRELPTSPARVSAKLVHGSIAQIQFGQFYPGVAQEALKAITDLQAKTKITGVIIDLRGNPGGMGAEAATLLGAFVHDTNYVSFCDADGKCDPQPVDNKTPLLHLPMVTLTDGNCASTCDLFAMAVKDLRLGTLVGTRTAGASSGPSFDYQLNDNTSTLTLPAQHALGANGEIIDTIGTSPDHQRPLTAADVSKGKDPAVDQAVSLLTS